MVICSKFRMVLSIDERNRRIRANTDMAGGELKDVLEQLVLADSGSLASAAAVGDRMVKD